MIPGYDLAVGLWLVVRGDDLAQPERSWPGKPSQRVAIVRDVTPT